MLWCYKCQKITIDDGTFKCSECGSGFVEHESTILREEGELGSPVREMSLVVQPVTIYQGDFVRSGVSIGVNMLDFSGNNLLQFLRSVLQQTRNGNSHIGIPSQMPGQMGDYVLGGEDQVRAMAEHLFNMDRQSLGSPPADKRFVQTLKTVKYKKDICNEDECMICLDQFNENEEIILLECGHPFHKSCLDPWLKLHSECPNCRHKLPTT